MKNEKHCRLMRIPFEDLIIFISTNRHPLQHFPIMRLVRYPPSRVNTAVHQLPEPDMVVDPRPISSEPYYNLKVTINGTTLTITRIDPLEDRALDILRDYLDYVETGWKYEIRFRMYNRNEDRHSFDSTKYIFHGLKHEYPPLDATEVIIKDGVKTIASHAFCGCRSLVKVTIPDSVKGIETCAFCYCESLRFIQLPPNLEYIGDQAFKDCSSLEAVFLPPTFKAISTAFHGCRSLRILNIPDSVERIVRNVIYNCNSLLLTDEMTDKMRTDKMRTDKIAEATREEQIPWLRNRYNPLHNLCCQPSPSPQAISQHIQDNNNNEERARTNDRPQFTALHLLVANPSLTADMITAYLQLAPVVAVMQDNIGQTPLHMLCSLPHFSDGTGSAIRAYLAFEKGRREAAFMMNHGGETPFQCLCEKSFDEMPFLKEDNKSFGGLFCWWFDCLNINLFVEQELAPADDVKENTKKRKFSGGDSF